MEIICTRPKCSRPLNRFNDLDDTSTLKTVQQKFCTSCGMPLILAGRYLPLRLLGQGGFGAAFLAKDRYTPALRTCVVKQFQPAGNLSPEALEIARQLFEREAMVLEDLGHRHEQIPDLYAFFPLIVNKPNSSEAEQFFYLVQEFIDGDTLEAELQQKQRFSETEVRDILTNLLNLLVFIHEHGSIHRDIKPSNIMRNSRGQLYLLDFGAVKQVTSNITGFNQSTGIYSLGFAPPEQMNGTTVYPSTDLYALAATCIQLLTGQPPQDLYDTFSNTWKWQPLVPQLSDRLKTVLERMLLPTPKDRFQSAQEVLEALETTPPSPPPLPQRPSPPPLSKPVTPRPSFALTEILSGAAFVGFEGAILAIALGSILPVSAGILVALVVVLMGGLVFILNRRWIEGKDLPILALISLALMLLQPLQKGLSLVPSSWLTLLNLSPFLTITAIAFISSLLAIASTSIFRLVYQILSLLTSR
jgi:serine/threonine-protein kinase